MSKWTSEEGLDERLNLLAETFVYRAVNNAIQVYGERNGAYGLEIIGPLDSKTCQRCEPIIGRTYRFGQFMPELPYHPHCRHTYRIIKAEEYNP